MKRLQSFILNFKILLLPSVVSHKKPRGTIWHIPYIVRAVIVQILQGVRKCSFGLRKPIILWLWAMCIEHVFVKSFILDCSFLFVSNTNIINYKQNYLEYQDTISYYVRFTLPSIKFKINIHFQGKLCYLEPTQANGNAAPMLYSSYKRECK